MAWTPTGTVISGNPILAAWGQTIENELAKRSSFMGTVATVADLPTNPEPNDWYLVASEPAIYIWDGSAWRKIAALNIISYSDPTVIELVDTGGAFEGIKYATFGVDENRYPSLFWVVFEATIASGTVQAKLELYSGGNLIAESQAISLTADGAPHTYQINVALPDTATPPLIVDARLSVNAATPNGSIGFTEIRAA